jgi:hypothetical protein
MANGLNRSSVLVNLTDVNGHALQDDIELKFYNVRLTSEKLQVRLAAGQMPARIAGLAAAPEGLSQVFITPKKYRFKSIFTNVQSDDSTRIDETFFVDPDRVKPQFPAFSDLQSQAVFAELARLLRDSGISTQQAWDALGDQPKAGLLNLYCKMEATDLDAAAKVTGFVRKIEQFNPARILARVAPNLMDLVGRATKTFHSVSGVLHEFDPPWKRAPAPNSWKTFDSAGNIQLTFATDGKNNFLADIDIDDHQGIQHAFDVLQHTITANDTHPYDVHEILIFFQHLTPGYSFT